MTAIPASDSARGASPGANNPVPFYFDVSGSRCFAWLHRGRPQARVGIVLCNPFGYEAVCAHRTLRYAATVLGANGYPTLRFDYPGTGDSSDPRVPGPAFDLWVDSAVTAG